MIDEWSALAATHGRKSVMSLAITDAELDAETERQIPILFGMISDQLHGHERTALDFGCGAGRWTHALAQCIHGRATGFDPCPELIAMARGEIDTDFVTGSPDAFFHECNVNETTFDVVAAMQVLGSPGLDLDGTAVALVGLVADDGLLIVVDHMPDIIPSGKWWRFRPRAVYQSLFAEYGVRLEQIGELRQLSETITVLGGRRL